MAWEPNGARFFDGNMHCEMVLVDEPERDVHGWLCYRGAEGQWVTYRKATEDDIAKLRERGVITHD